MIGIEQELLNEIDWRTAELSIIRTTPILCNCTPKQRKIMEKYSVVAIYSIWEGFVTTVFNLYVREINTLELTCDEINPSILTHDLFEKYGLSDEQQKHFSNKIKFIINILNCSKKPVSISSSIPTESNVNFKVINQILNHFNLNLLSEPKFKKHFDKLLLFRNKVAHGECSLVIDDKIIEEFNSTVIDAMHEVTIRIIDGYSMKKYLKEVIE